MTSVNGEAPGPHVAQLLGTVLDHTRRALLDADAAGLRVSQLRVVTSVPADGTSVTALAELLGMTKQGCGQLVSALVDSGHLQVGVDPADARVRVVRRTARGEAAVAAAGRVVDAVESAWVERVGARRYAVFRSVLAELAGLPGPADPAAGGAAG